MLEKLRRFDYLLALCVIALAVCGIFLIYSATNLDVMPESARADFSNLYRSQILFVVSGSVLMLVMAFIDYHFIGKLYIPIYLLCIGLLVLVIIIGKTTSDLVPDRWIIIPIPGMNQNVSIQPSEFAKIFMVIVLAKFIDTHKDSFNHFLMLLIILAGIAIPVGLVFAQPSLSAGIVVLAVPMVALFTGGLHYRTIFIALLIIIPLAFLVWFDLQRSEPFIKQLLNANYQWDRIQDFINPPEAGSDSVQQLEASLFSIGSGGLYGKGFMNNTYIPYGHNDFIFSVAAEQFGFAGCMGILGAMAFFVVKCVLIALRAPDLQGRLIATGVAGMLLVETFLNVGVVTGILPTTGVAFPFLSSGGSIIWVHMAAMGLVLNVAMTEKGK